MNKENKPSKSDEFVTSDTPNGEITNLLVECQQGNQTAKDQLIVLIYQELRRLAQSYINQENKPITLQATALVHEAYLKLFGQENLAFHNRNQLLALAATQMRRILVDYARAKATLKRGKGNIFVTLNEEKAGDIKHSFNLEILDLDIALSELTNVDPRQSQIVELKFFAGLTTEEIENILGISSATVEREWQHARIWLHNRLK